MRPRVATFFSLLLCLCALAACETREEILLIPLEGGEPRWLAVEAEASLLARHVDDEARWLVAQAVGRAACLSASAQRNPQLLEEDIPTDSTSKPAQARAASRGSARVRGPIDPNTASLRQLESLPRVGPATARAIVAGRPYSRVQDLRRVRGIGPATLEAMSSMLEIAGANGHSDRPVNP